MANNQDFEDMLRCLNDAKTRYLIVGAYAVAFYTEPRYTKDIDIWIEPTPNNAKRVYEALRKFGAPIKDLTIEDLSNPKLVYQIGVAPVRIDIIMCLQGITFADAWKNKKVTRFGKQRTYIMGISELMKAKKVSKRPQDIIDFEKLSRV